jgi:hypothetical protein
MTVGKKNRLANAIQKIAEGWVSVVQFCKAKIFQIGKRNIQNWQKKYTKLKNDK